MASISSRNLVDAVLRVERMTFQERDRLADEVYARQPNLFASVIVLHRYGATHVQMDVVLNLLLVFHEAMKINGGSWRAVSEDVQERCLARVSGRVRFIEGLSPQMQAQARLLTLLARTRRSREANLRQSIEPGAALAVTDRPAWGPAQIALC